MIALENQLLIRDCLLDFSRLINNEAERLEILNTPNEELFKKALNIMSLAQIVDDRIKEKRNPGRH